MSEVADYINEVQRLCETYGVVLDSLSKDQTFSEVITPPIIMVELYSDCNDCIAEWHYLESYEVERTV